MSWTVPGMGALLPVWMTWRAAGLASAALAALPEKVAVLVKLTKEAGVNCELYWQAPPMATLMEEETTQSVVGCGREGEVRLVGIVEREASRGVAGGEQIDGDGWRAGGCEGGLGLGALESEDLVGR